MDFGHAYLLTLADGQKWELTASKKYNDQLGRFASILQLKKEPTSSNSKIIFTGENIDLFPLALTPIYLKTVENGGLPFHTGLITRDGYGFILPARWGGGKSTCCARVPPPWLAPADDEVLVVRVGEDDYRVHPFPTWSNFTAGRDKRSWEVQGAYPLKAILFLEQSRNDRLHPLSPGAASARIYESAEQAIRRCLVGLGDQQKLELKKKLFENSCALARQIPAYILEFSLNGRFWECLEKIRG